MLLICCLSQTFAATCGDANASGSIDVVDALVIAQYYVGLSPANFDPTAADVNGDSAIDILDALRIAQYYVGLVSELSCSGTTPIPGTTTSSGGGNITVRARGTMGGEILEIQVNGNTVASFTMTTSYSDYSASGSGTVRVAFTNDDQLENGMDIQVDYADIDGTRYQAENQAINTGVYVDGACGGSNSEWLQCNGYIEFNTSGGTTTTSGGTTTTTSSGGGTTISGNQVIVIGESFIAMSHEITRNLENLARNAGILPSNESFIDNSVSGTRLSGGISPTIPQQYANGNTQKQVRWVIMDGGGNDCLQGSCSNPPTSSCQDLQNAANAANNLLQQMGNDGVVKVLYFFYPEPVGSSYSDLKAKLDVLRPMIQNIVNSTSNPQCYWLDLRPVWNGHPEYTSDGIHPTSAGSEATANAIWDLIQQNNFFSGK